MDVTKIGKQILSFIDEQAEKFCMPIQQGNSVRIKHLVVRENSYGFLLYDLKQHRQIKTTFTKTAALAMAKQLASNNKTCLRTIETMDDKIQDKYNECVFYKHTMSRTEDETKREVAKIRYDVVWEDLLQLRDELEQYIFDK